MYKILIFIFLSINLNANTQIERFKKHLPSILWYSYELWGDNNGAALDYSYRSYVKNCKIKITEKNKDIISFTLDDNLQGYPRTFLLSFKIDKSTIIPISGHGQFDNDPKTRRDIYKKSFLLSKIEYKSEIHIFNMFRK